MIDIAIEGVGAWSPAWGNWNDARDALAGNAAQTQPAGKPSPAILSPNERRRVPEAVRLALAVAEQACAMAGREPKDLPNLFASSYGDLQINDYLCATLAENPLDISPTRFHNSVHNAPAGYWAITAGCMCNSTAISAGEHTFGAGLLEAALQASDMNMPVLYVVSDIAATGPLADVVASREAFGAAFVFAPARFGTTCVARAGLTLASAAALPQARPNDNPAADALPLLCALASAETANLTLAAGPRLFIEMEMRFD